MNSSTKKKSKMEVKAEETPALEKEKKHRRKLSLFSKIVLTILGIALAAVVVYLIYYFTYYVGYKGYRKYLSSYEYETGTPYAPLSDSQSNVQGMDLVAENEYLKLYADTATGNVAVYDKRDGSITYSNPLNPDDDSIANSSNIAYMKSQFVLTYYNNDAVAGTYDSYTYAVARNQVTVESIQDGIRFLYRIGEVKDNNGNEGISFDIPLEYRLVGDGMEVSIPASGIHEYGNGAVGRIQLLRFMGAAHNDEEGYMVVPNGSGSLIRFNNGKTSAPFYSQYIYDIDPLVASNVTTENTLSARLPLFGICREDRSLLVTVEDGASSALITAGISGSYNEYNYAYPTFVFRNVDNLKNFGNATSDIYIMEPNLYDMNCRVRYTFLNGDYTGYTGLANYYRERLISEGVLEKKNETGDIPFYYDVICGVKEYSHFLGVQYLHIFSMTDFDEAEEMSNILAKEGITNQVMNLQGWFNGGYYHDAVEDMRVIGKLGGKKGISRLQATLAANGGSLYLDAALQQVTFADRHFNYSAQGVRYYGTGYVATFGQVNPTTLYNASGLDYMETKYDILSPKFLPRYTAAFVKNIKKITSDGISLRDMGNLLTSDKKRTEMISREEALDIVLAQFDLLETTGRKLMTADANSYAFAYSSDILNVPIEANEYKIVDETIPLYEMIIHGSIDYSSKLLNYEDSVHMQQTVLQMIEAGAAPHYVFTWEEANEMKDTGLNRYYDTTFAQWKEPAIACYNQVNDALGPVQGAFMVGHEILDNGVRKVTYDNGVIIYVNYSDAELTADGVTVPAAGYRVEGK